MKLKYGFAIIILLNLFLLIFRGYPAESEKSPYYISLRFLPDINIPLGKKYKEILRFGSGTDISIRCQMPFWPVLFLEGTFGYTAFFTKVDTSVSGFDFGAGIGLNVNIASRFLLGFVVRGGYNYSFVHDGSGNSSWLPLLFCGLDLGLKLAPSFSLNAQVGYKKYFGLVSNLTFSVGMGFHINLRKEKAFEFYKLDTEKILPAQLYYHNSNPIGKLIIRNTGEKEIEGLEIKLNTQDYMDKPLVWEVQKKIESRGSAEIDLYAQFNEDALTVTEKTKVKMEISLKYRYKQQWIRQKFYGDLLFYSKNRFIQDDIHKLALFVTPHDSSIRTFALISIAIADLNEYEFISPNLIKAMLIYSALSSSSIEFKIDTNQGEQDFINFPHETLANRQGNMEELGLLFCSLLEASGIETAIIPLPDKILFAFSLGVESTEEFVSHPEKLIFYKRRAWVPLVITGFDKSFLSAWLSGIEESYSVDIENVLFTISEAQSIYIPAEPQFPDIKIQYPDAYDVFTAYNEYLKEYIYWEVKPRVDKLLTGFTENEENHCLLNKIGVLYARYGLYDEALSYFDTILLEDEYVPALMNSGHVYFIRGGYKKALSFYERAYIMAPSEPLVILSVAKLNYATGNYSSAQEAYLKLDSLDPELASQYSYLELTDDEVPFALKETIEMEGVIWED
jgi:tetratricopeptide (TPR) repeat protein